MKKLLTCLVLSASLLHAIPGSACECPSKPTLSQEIEQSNAIFVGRVIQQDRDKPIVFEVQKTFKGEPQKVFAASPARTKCDYFSDKSGSVGQVFLVFSTLEKGKAIIHRCSRTELYTESKLLAPTLQELENYDPHGLKQNGIHPVNPANETAFDPLRRKCERAADCLLVNVYEVPLGGAPGKTLITCLSKKAQLRKDRESSAILGSGSECLCRSHECVLK